VQGVIVLSHLTASSRLDSFISTHRGGPGMAAIFCPGGPIILLWTVWGLSQWHQKVAQSSSMHG